MMCQARHEPAFTFQSLVFSTMERRSLAITVTSAKGLEKVSKMDVYVAVKLSGDPKFSDHPEQRTQVASGTSPRWIDGAMKFAIDQSLAEANRLVITFKIKCEQRGGGGGDKDIGEVHVPVKELLDHLGNDKAGQRYVTYKIKKTNGKPGGDISFTYSFTGPVAAASGVGCSRYIAHEPVRPPPATYRPVNLNGPGPVLSQLLPSVGSFSYGHVPVHQPPVYPPLAPPEILPPTCFPGLYPPHGYPMMSYTPESPPTMYASIFPGLSCPPEGYPNAAPPQTQPALYPPMNPYRF
ncbi:protein SRC2 [Raphanus sativus]|uniref:Protein SRC2 n=1 Tax=Raphanus sativus TaxID=3726 RepID=A0A6J0NCA8_RAPSA|nr:protein SRC2 [Raphanus sativus]